MDGFFQGTGARGFDKAKAKTFLGAAPALRKALFVFSFCVSATLAPNAATAFSSHDFYRAAQKYDYVNPFAAAVHCSLETGNWRSRLWVDGNNGAGIKVNRTWRALGMPVMEVVTKEHYNGKEITVRSAFRKYSSIDKFLTDYSRKIRDDYPVSAKNNDNVWGYMGGLHRGRNGSWATDARYFEKLVSKAVRMAPYIYGERWRDFLVGQYRTAKTSGALDARQMKTIERALGVI